MKVFGASQRERRSNCVGSLWTFMKIKFFIFSFKSLKIIYEDVNVCNFHLGYIFIRILRETLPLTFARLVER